MELVSSLPALGATGTGAVIAFKSPELLKEIYGDLAKPGVSQVGKAIGSILGLGNTILIPLRLLNEAGRAFEQRSFEQIAERFKTIPEEEIVSPPPEVAIPIMEKLSQTQDKTLREMFIELLAKASSCREVDKVHPSFSQVISSIAPDEGLLMQSFLRPPAKPLVSMELGYESSTKGSATLNDLILLPPEEVSNPANIPLFLSNLSGLGVIEILRDSRLTAPNAYDKTIEYAKNLHPFPDEMEVGGEKRKLVYKKFLCKLSPYGQRLLAACT